MKLEYRLYGKGGVCPQPVVHAGDKLLLLVTPWAGSTTGADGTAVENTAAQAQKVLHIIRDAFLSARSDPERTNPFPVLDCVSTTANQLLNAIQLANRYVFENLNPNEYSFGFEVLAVVQNQQQFLCISSGGAGVLVLPSATTTKTTCLHPIIYGQTLCDQSADPYLPQNVLGVQSSCYLQVHNYRPAAGDKLLVVWHPRLPVQFLQAATDATNLDQWHKHLAACQPEASFWLGLVQI